MPAGVTALPREFVTNIVTSQFFAVAINMVLIRGTLLIEMAFLAKEYLIDHFSVSWNLS